MFCPRCGRAINENANFCGGCGLSRAEIEKFVQASKVTNEAAQPEEPVNPTPAAQPEIIAEPVVAEVVAETETVVEPAAETETVVEPVAEVVTEAETTAKTAEQTTETSYKYTAPEGAEYHYTAQTNPANSTTATSYTYAQPTGASAYSTEKPVKSENLSTVDFIWMMLISSIPVVGIIYIIYLAIQNNNTNKRSYARATLIIALFGTIVGIVFGLGFLIAGL